MILAKELAQQKGALEIVARREGNNAPVFITTAGVILAAMIAGITRAPQKSFFIEMPTAGALESGACSRTLATVPNFW